MPEARETNAARQVPEVSLTEGYWLILTTSFDYRIDEYVTAQHKLNDILKSHKPVNCAGLGMKWECSICQDEYNDPKYGMRLSALLKRIEQEELRDRKVAELDVIKYMEVKTGRRTTIEEESESL